MKPFTKIPETVLKLNFADIYRFTCLSFTPRSRKSSYTDSTYKQIMALTKDTSKRTFQYFVERLRKAEIIKIATLYYGLNRRNRYYIPFNFKQGTRINFISNKILDLDLKMHEKGFLIALTFICEQDANFYKVSTLDITKKFNCSQSSVKNHITTLLKKGCITKTKDCIFINGNLIYNSNINKIESFKIANGISEIIRCFKWKTIKNKEEIIKLINEQYGNNL